MVAVRILQKKDGSAIHAAVAGIAQNARVKSGCGEDWKVLNVLHKVSETFSLKLIFQRSLKVYFDD
jgi:NADH dehydrogenase (ubiquinone) Fe-S protein 1